MDSFRKSGRGDGEERKMEIGPFSTLFKNFLFLCIVCNQKLPWGRSWNCSQAWCQGTTSVSLFSFPVLTAGNMAWFKTSGALTAPLHTAESWGTDLICQNKCFNAAQSSNQSKGQTCLRQGVIRGAMEARSHLLELSQPGFRKISR